MQPPKHLAAFVKEWKIVNTSLPEDGMPAGNQATGLLKLIALAFMFCDHAGKMLAGNMQELRLLGRIAFPIYCWCIVCGACRTRSMPKYLLRIVAVGLVTQPLYMVALNHTWTEPNVFLTLALGLCGIWGLKEKRFLSQLWAPAAVLVLAVLSGTDYGWKGVLFIMLLYGARTSRPAIAAMMIAFCLYWGSTSATVSSFFGIAINPPAQLASLLTPWLKLQGLAILSLPLILCRFPKDVRYSKWIGYAIYPAHLVILWLLELVR